MTAFSGILFSMKIYSRTVRPCDADPIESDPLLGEDRGDNEISAGNIANRETDENQNQHINIHIGHCNLNDSSLNLPINTD